MAFEKVAGWLDFVISPKYFFATGIELLILSAIAVVYLFLCPEADGAEPMFVITFCLGIAQLIFGVAVQFFDWFDSIGDKMDKEKPMDTEQVAEHQAEQKDTFYHVTAVLFVKSTFTSRPLGTFSFNLHECDDDASALNKALDILRDMGKPYEIKDISYCQSTYMPNGDGEITSRVVFCGETKGMGLFGNE